MPRLDQGRALWVPEPLGVVDDAPGPFGKVPERWGFAGLREQSRDEPGCVTTRVESQPSRITARVSPSVPSLSKHVITFLILSNCGNRHRAEFSHLTVFPHTARRR